MAVDRGIVGAPTGAWRVTVDRSAVAAFARAVGDEREEYRDERAARASGLAGVPAPPTFTFAAPYWASTRAEDQPVDPAGGRNPMHGLMGELHAQGALVLHGEQAFEYHRPVVAGDVLDGAGEVVDVYEKETDAARMTFIVMETRWTDARRGEPVVTERFNLIARLEK